MKWKLTDPTHRNVWQESRHGKHIVQQVPVSTSPPSFPGVVTDHDRKRFIMDCVTAFIEECTYLPKLKLIWPEWARVALVLSGALGTADQCKQLECSTLFITRRPHHSVKEIIIRLLLFFLFLTFFILNIFGLWCKSSLLKCELLHL